MAEWSGFDIGNRGRTSDVYLVAVGIVLLYKTVFCACDCLVISTIPEERPLRRPEV